MESYDPIMKLFGSRGRAKGGRAERSPLEQTVALFKAGRYVAAESEARAVAAARSGQRDDPYVPLASSIAALAAGAQGRHDEAVAGYDAVLPDFGRIFGADDPQTLKVRSDRAQELAALGRHEECEAECVEVIRIAAGGAGPEAALLTQAARNGLIFAVNAQGRHAEAEQLAREALTAQREQDRFALVLRLGLARSLNGQARYEAALAEAERAEAQRHILSEAERRTEIGAVEVVLAAALRGLGRESEARDVATAAYDACLAAFGPAHRRTVECRELVGGVEAA